MKRFIYILLFFLILVNLSYRLEKVRAVKEKATEILYLPRGKILRNIALDHRNSLADFLWLQFIQYYGYHLQTDRKYPYLYPILDVLTDLDEKFLYAYTFGSVLLAHDAKDRYHAEKLLMKAMYNDPYKWQYPFWMGFLNYVFFKDYKKAAQFFKLATLEPGAPDMCFRFYAFIYYRKLKDLETALRLWKYMYENAKSDFEKKIAEDYIKKTIVKIHERDLTKIVRNFIKKEKYYPRTLEELIKKGYLKEIPQHPYGGYYYIRGDSVYSETPKK